MLSPKLIPAATPAQNAIIFFKAPPSSTPLTSYEVYTLNLSFDNKFCISFCKFSSFDATTKSVGIAIDTSSAWLGPDNAAIFAFGISSAITSSNVDSVSLSNPLLHSIIG